MAFTLRWARSSAPPLRIPLALLLLALLPRPAAADGEPAAATEWIARLRAHYTPHRDLSAAVVPHATTSLVPSCATDTPGESAQPWPGKFSFEPWTVSATVRYGDENVFFKEVEITIGRLTSDGDLIHHWEAAVDRSTRRPRPAPVARPSHASGPVPVGGPVLQGLPDCSSTYRYLALIQVGRDVLRFDAACDEMKSLYPYELADLLAAATAGGEKPNPSMVMNDCGELKIGISLTALLPKPGDRPRKTYGGHLMPTDREAVRTQARGARPDPTAALARAQRLRKSLDQCIADHAGRHPVPDPLPITLSPAGLVRAVGLGPNPPRKLDRCAQWVTRTWQFAPQGEEVTILLPSKRTAR